VEDAELSALAFELPCNAVSLVEVVREDGSE
jgi:hypothetical protein